MTKALRTILNIHSISSSSVYLIKILLVICSAIFLVNCGGGSGNNADEAVNPEISPAQNQVNQLLEDRRNSGEITEQEFETLRSQIQPVSIVEARFAALEQDRRGIDDLIAVQGYVGQEDCYAPPDFLLAAEIVPRTPDDPTDRLQRRNNPVLDTRATRTAVDSYLADAAKPASVNAMFQRAEIDLWGSHHARYQQTHNGIPLTKGSLIVHQTPDNERVVEDLTIDLESFGVSTTPFIPEFDARALALTNIDPTGSGGYLASAELMIDPELENVLIDPDNMDNGASYEWQVKDAKLIYRVLVAPDYSDLNQAFDANFSSSASTIDDRTDSVDRAENTFLGGREETEPTTDEPWAYPNATPWLVFVDALSGAVLSKESLLHSDFDEIAAPPMTGTGYGHFNSKVDLDTTFWPPFDAYVLADFSRSKSGTANMVMHARNLDSHDLADFDFMLDGNNIWGNGKIDFSDPACIHCTTGQTPAVDIAFGIQRTYDFLDNVLGRWGIDDAGLNQVALAHWDMEYGDAHYNGASGLIAFGNGKDSSKPGNYSMGTVAHEIAHSIWKQEKVGTNGNPAKAMNEGHGDILGGLVDIYQDNTDGNGSWLYRIPWAGGKWRSRTLDPSSYDECVTSNEITMCEIGSRYWDFFTEISTFEHVAGIPFTRAIMHLAEGTEADMTSPYYSKFFPSTPMRGIGLNKAARIWMHMVTYYLPDSPNLAEGRLAAWQAAEALFGANSTEAKATANAFAAVGMGLPFNGSASPSIPFAKVHSLNLRTLTAKTYAALDDDTGAEFVEPAGMARKNDTFLGYLDLSELPVGQSTVNFKVVDSDGNETTTSRICNLRYRPQLLENGGFEDGSSDWVNAQNANDEGGAFLGENFLKVRPAATQQTVNLSAVKAPELSYWVGASKGIEPDDFLRVRVLDTDQNQLAILATHDIDEEWTPRPARSNGYINFRHDLSDWQGQEIVIEFEASRSNIFRLDHAVVSYASVLLLPPTVEIFETDNSIFLTLFNDDFAPFDAMDLKPRIYIDGAETTLTVTQSGNPSRRTIQIPIDSISAGAHFTHTVAVTESGAFIAAGDHEWFAPTPVKELLTNGRFENQLDGWEIDGNGVLLEEASLGGKVYQGEYAARLGGVGSANEASISRDVVVPFSIKSLKFTARVRREYSDTEPTETDKLVVDFLDASDEILDSAILYDTADIRLDHEPPHNISAHFLVSYAPSTAALAGKTVKVRLRVSEDDQDESSFIVDNASFSYSEWGVQVGL